MATAAVEQSSQRHLPIASWSHTCCVLVVVLASAYIGSRTSESLRSASDVNRVLLYARTMLREWLVLALVIWGVRRSGGSLGPILGETWSSAGKFFRDLAVATCFWIPATLILSALRSLLSALGTGHSILFMLPQTQTEKLIWVLLCLTAGICEEAIHRGYFQRQFTAWTGSLPLGILLAGAVFGLGHSYQGAEGAIVNGFHGVLLGSLAAWRRSLRPGMISHTWTDLFAGIIAKMLHIRVS